MRLGKLAWMLLAFLTLFAVTSAGVAEAERAHLGARTGADHAASPVDHLTFCWAHPELPQFCAAVDRAPELSLATAESEAPQEYVRAEAHALRPAQGPALRPLPVRRTRGAAIAPWVAERAAAPALPRGPPHTRV